MNNTKSNNNNSNNNISTTTNNNNNNNELLNIDSNNSNVGDISYISSLSGVKENENIRMTNEPEEMPHRNTTTDTFQHVNSIDSTNWQPRLKHVYPQYTYWLKNNVSNYFQIITLIIQVFQLINFPLEDITASKKVDNNEYKPFQVNYCKNLLLLLFLYNMYNLSIYQSIYLSIYFLFNI